MTPMKPHPYRGLPPHQFWVSGVTDVPLGSFDPVISTKFSLGASDKVSTLGSCFAQHLARHIQKSGLTYLTTEPPTDAESVDADLSQIASQFSARYGNVYTTRQALQLFERAIDGWEPHDSIWERDGRFFDAFRPRVYPKGFSSPSELIAQRTEHLAAVKRVFCESDVVVFTLGLTESWVSRRDGAVYPLAPGVFAGEMRPEIYEFRNFNFSEVYSDLMTWCRRLREVNPNVRILLTVSPVPLNATYESQNVWVATSYSKGVLRAAAGEVAREFAYVDYFPSYEVIMNPQNQGRYFEDDLREVREIGVQHVMRIFDRHYGKARLENESTRRMQERILPTSNDDNQRSISDVFCDEDLLSQ